MARREDVAIESEELVWQRLLVDRVAACSGYLAIPQYYPYFKEFALRLNPCPASIGRIKRNLLGEFESPIQLIEQVTTKLREELWKDTEQCVGRREWAG